MSNPLEVDDYVAVSDDDPILSQTTLNEIADRFDVAHPADVAQTLRAMRKFINVMTHKHHNRLTIAKMVDSLNEVLHKLDRLIAYENQYQEITGYEARGLGARKIALRRLLDIADMITGETVENYPLHILRQTFKKETD